MLHPNLINAMQSPTFKWHYYGNSTGSITHTGLSIVLHKMEDYSSAVWQKHVLKGEGNRVQNLV